jgi:predicted permease
MVVVVCSFFASLCVTRGASARQSERFIFLPAGIRFPNSGFVDPFLGGDHSRSIGKVIKSAVPNY